MDPTRFCYEFVVTYLHNQYVTLATSLERVLIESFQVSSSNPTQQIRRNESMASRINIYSFFQTPEIVILDIRISILDIQNNYFGYPK